MVTLNLSWMPDYMYERLARFATARKLSRPISGDPRSLDVSEPLYSRVRNCLHLVEEGRGSHTRLHLSFPVTTPHLCILIGSCDKYRVLAEWTAARLERMWPDHPPVFFSGITTSLGAPCLPFQGDPRDWMEVTLRAVESLLERGFRWTYLILDDLLPVSPLPCRVP